LTAVFPGDTAVFDTPPTIRSALLDQLNVRDAFCLLRPGAIVD
jgi:hypothetical protein